MLLYYLENARNEEQRAKMVRLEASGTCVFCPEYLSQDPDQPTLFRGRNWTVTPNRFPYKGAREHLLLIPDDHVEDLVDLSPEALSDFWLALTWARDQYISGHYGLGARNGDPRFTGGTIRHLHVHLIVGDVEDPQHEAVRMKLSSRPKPSSVH